MTYDSLEQMAETLVNPVFVIAGMLSLGLMVMTCSAATEAEVQRVTAADVTGPDGIVYPLFTFAGVTGGIPNTPVVVQASDHGLPRDEKTDASKAIQAALDEAGSRGGGAVLLPKGRYVIDQTLRLTRDGVVLRGEDRADVVLLPRFEGTKVSDHSNNLISIERAENPLRLDVALTEGLQRGQTEIPVPEASRFEVGQRVVLTALPPPEAVALLSPSGLEHITKGTYGSIYSYQHFVIKEVTSKGVLVDRPVRLNLPMAQKPFLRRVDLVRGCGIENLTIAQEVERKDIHGISLNSTADCWIKDVTMTKIGDWPVGVGRSMNFEIRGSDFNESRSLGGARAYFGVSFSSDGLIDDCRINHFRHFSIQLAANGNVIRNCDLNNVDVNFHFHWPYENLIENCRVDATPGPDPDTKSRGSYGYGIYTPDSEGGDHNPAGPRNTFYNNTFISDWDGVMLGGGSTLETIVAYNLFDAKRSTGAVIKPGSDGTVLFGNTFILRDPHRRRMMHKYGHPRPQTLIGAVIFPGGPPARIRVENNLFYGAPVEGLFGVGTPAVESGNRVVLPWTGPAGSAPVGTVSLAGEWNVRETVRLEAAPSPDQLHADPSASEKTLALVSTEDMEADWDTVTFPQMLVGPVVDWKNFDGELVARRTFDLPETLRGRDLNLSLGVIDDHDTTWINGVEVGSTKGPDGWKTVRNYQVPTALLKAEGNVIVIRMWDSFGGGGMAGIPEDLWIGPEGSEQHMNLPSEISRIAPPVPSLFEWQKSSQTNAKR